jgi:hypothetical protein
VRFPLGPQPAIVIIVIKINMAMICVDFIIFPIFLNRLQHNPPTTVGYRAIMSYVFLYVNGFLWRPIIERLVGSDS